MEEVENRILELINEGMDIDEITVEVYKDKCVAIEFDEDYPTRCCEDADCFDCWNQRIVRIAEDN